MDLDKFIADVKAHSTYEDLVDFARKKVLHGTPYVFKDREEEYYEFRKLIANKFNISFHEVYIMGSAKLGFSHVKRTVFSLDSDVDVALISDELFDRYMKKIASFQMKKRSRPSSFTEETLRKYHEFLEYAAIGWMRPDMLPVSFDMKVIKDEWFDYFRSISSGKTSVGNYEVKAGVFKTYKHLEDYIVEGLAKVRDRKSFGGIKNDNAD